MKIGVIFGTRPEIIKLSVILRLLKSKRGGHFALHTGQHYSYKMDSIFFRELGLPQPKHHLTMPAVSGHGAQTAFMLDAIEKILLKEKPDAILVQGDTNSVLAGALAASKIRGIAIGHVEAGLRSYDRQMPEELNRIMVDHVAHYLFAPTTDARRLLEAEGIPKAKIRVTGNTIVDAVLSHGALARKKIDLKRLLPSGVSRYALLTMHRQENVDHPQVLRSILAGLDLVSKAHHLPIIFPAHPRTVKMIKHFGIQLPPTVRMMEPVGFLGFLRLEEAADLILTDSGGVQEEACILRVPCVTLRTSTERPETVKVGANRIAGHDPHKILTDAAAMLSVPRRWRNPFGDGKASERILKTVLQ